MSKWRWRKDIGAGVLEFGIRWIGYGFQAHSCGVRGFGATPQCALDALLSGLIDECERRHIGVACGDRDSAFALEMLSQYFEEAPDEQA
jgi:hypothetical protein